MKRTGNSSASHAQQCSDGVPPQGADLSNSNPVDSFAQNLLNALPSQIAVLDEKGKVLLVNESWTTFGRENGRDQAHTDVGASYFEVCRQAQRHGDISAGRVLQGLEAVLARKSRRYTCEYPCHSPLKQRWFTLESMRVPGVPGLLVIHTDITAAKSSEEAVRSVALFPSENPNPVLRVSRDCTLLYANPASQLLLAHWHCKVGDPLPESLRPVIAQADSRGRTVEHEESFDGRVFSLLVTPIAGRDYVNIYGRDITERRRAEEQLRELTQRLSYHVEHSPVAVIEWGPDMRLIRWSGEAERIFGWRAEEVLGKRMDEFRWVYDEDQAQVKDVSTGLQTGTNPRGMSLNRNYRKDGTIAYCEWYNSSLRDESGKLRSILSLVLDVTERTRAEQALLESEKRLEQLVAERTAALQQTTDQLNAFVYTLAHDLRAPLRAQAAFAVVLLEDFGNALGETGRAYARKIAESAERQGALLADLLRHIGLSRSEFPLEPVDLMASIKQAQTDLVLEVQQKKAQVHVGPIADRVIANAASLHLVLTNLLSNALKFVAQGVIPEVKIWTTPSDGYVRLWIADNGLGIPLEHMNKMFGMFQRVHPGAQYPGTGIGLAIVKKAVERMGGHVGVESEPGKGSRFWVDLRFAP